MCPIVIGELLFGFKNGQRETANHEQLTRFLQIPSVECPSVTKRTAEFFAMIMMQLRKAGTPIPTHDIWIAASAMEHGARLVTRDQHFKKEGHPRLGDRPCRDLHRGILFV